jgi:hypothetical protein
MDFDKLIEPYSENGRTLGGQINWLLKKGIPQTSIDYAVSSLYKRLDCGEIFKDGHELDTELLNIAKEHQLRDFSDRFKKTISEVENNLDLEWNKLSKVKKILAVLGGKA